MKNKKIYIILHETFNSVIIDSVWDNEKLANRRLEDIKKQIYKDYNDKEVADEEWEEWGKIEIYLNIVEVKRIY